ncbi:hypothetical protein A0H76_887 [Hepatospora eriocheir]|uniref:Uncharacterized protein n=1 Tax=Hepatospora eriocheir TaxID=1081669 RepID=A0A1X0QI28_9MICR|nr:hypothetical protein A0H76_887 [Hepatospora eriocheir]
MRIAPVKINNLKPFLVDLNSKQNAMNTFKISKKNIKRNNVTKLSLTYTAIFLTIVGTLSASILLSMNKAI